MTAAATPRPWTVNDERRHEVMYDPDGDRIVIAECFGLPDDGETEANAALIVRAVNAHDALVEACDMARAYVSTHKPPALQVLGHTASGAEVYNRGDAIAWREWQVIEDALRAALELARGGKP